jgi:hypothetical protein
VILWPNSVGRWLVEKQLRSNPAPRGTHFGIKGGGTLTMVA